VLLHREFGDEWSEISRHLPGRSEAKVRERWAQAGRRSKVRAWPLKPPLLPPPPLLARSTALALLLSLFAPPCPHARFLDSSCTHTLSLSYSHTHKHKHTSLSLPFSFSSSLQVSKKDVLERYQWSLGLRGDLHPDTQASLRGMPSLDHQLGKLAAEASR
jgi:hypothetical protein